MKIGIWILCLGIWILPDRLSAADSIDALIDQEKQEQKAWADDDEELPVTYFWGDKKGAEIYSAAANAGKGNLICEPVEFDELIEHSRGDLKSAEVILNVALPRVREIIQNACLIRPEDTLLAVGEGWSQRVAVKGFTVKRDPSVCPQDSPYSLWATFEKPLPETPLFFSTDRLTPEGTSYFKVLEPVTSVVIDTDTEKTLLSVVPDRSDYTLTLYSLGDTAVDKVFLLRRKVISPEDNGLPNELVLYQLGSQIEKLWVERVDVKKGSGHLALKGALDFNADGSEDLILTGDHARCVYSMVFQGGKTGFSVLDLPVKPCACW